MSLDQYVDTDVVMPKGIPFIPFNVKNKIFEVSCALFDNCNLACTFCFSKRKDNKIDKEHILSMPDEIMPHVLKDIKKYNLEVLNVRSWGGELFFDQIPDEIFETYKQYAQKYIDICAKECPNVKVRIHWLSNGIWTKWERVLDLLKATNATLSFSYDPVNRFTSDAQKDLLFENIHRFFDYRNTLSITLTKSNMQAYIKGDKWVDSLDKYKFKIDANYYWPNRDYKTNMPNDEDLYQFLKWGLDQKRWNIDIIHSALASGLQKSNERYCNCFFTGQYNLGRYTKNCVARTSILDPNEFYASRASEVTEENCQAVKNSLMLQKRKCLLCPCYQYCCMGCMGAMLHKDYIVDKECPYKRIFEYIQQNRSMFEEEFDNWDSSMGGLRDA